MPLVDFASVVQYDGTPAVASKGTTEAQKSGGGSKGEDVKDAEAAKAKDAAAEQTEGAKAEAPKEVGARSSTNCESGCGPTRLAAIATLRLRNFCTCLGLPIEDAAGMCSMLELKENAQAIKSCEAVLDMELIEARAELQIVAVKQLVTAMKKGEKDTKIMHN